jgi:glycosyltransferase involved in cell wall biosynthesis
VAAARTGLPLVVLGEGTLAHAVKMDAAAAGVPLLLRGWAEREDVLRILARATALVFPSLWPEPLSRVLLEALALGVPIAAMETGGTAEILAPGGGLLAHDTAGLAEALARIVSEPALRDELRLAARARATVYAPDALVPRYEAVYRRLA